MGAVESHKLHHTLCGVYSTLQKDKVLYCGLGVGLGVINHSMNEVRQWYEVYTYQGIVLKQTG